MGEDGARGLKTSMKYPRFRIGRRYRIGEKGSAGGEEGEAGGGTSRAVTPCHIERIIHFRQTGTLRYGSGDAKAPYLPKPMIDYYKTFYGDTACYGATPTLMHGYSFFGANHILFAADVPWDAAESCRFRLT